MTYYLTSAEIARRAPSQPSMSPTPLQALGAGAHLSLLRWNFLAKIMWERIAKKPFWCKLLWFRWPQFLRSNMRIFMDAVRAEPVGGQDLLQLRLLPMPKGPTLQAHDPAVQTLGFHRHCAKT